MIASSVVAGALAVLLSASAFGGGWRNASWQPSVPVLDENNSVLGGCLI